MKWEKSINYRSRIKSLKHACDGWVEVFKLEPNAKLHAIAAILAVAAGIVKHISPLQWVAVIFCIGLVLITEAINTCIERLCDIICNNEYSYAIKVIKDIAAAAVLMAAIISVVIGVIIFFL